MAVMGRLRSNGKVSKGAENASGEEDGGGVSGSGNTAECAQRNRLIALK